MTTRAPHAPESVGRVIRVLLVDDDEDSRVLYAEYLVSVAGHEVVQAADGQGALEKAAALQPHVIVMDISLPDLDGRAVLRALRADPKTNAIPVVALTGRAELRESNDSFDRLSSRARESRAFQGRSRVRSSRFATPERGRDEKRRSQEGAHARRAVALLSPAMPEESEIGEVGVDKVGEEATEHAREHGHHTPWMRWLGLSTALFAVLAAIASLKAGHFANEALLHSAEATLKQAQASDQWAYFQAKGTKAVTRASAADVLAALHGPDDAIARARADAEKYKKEQDEVQVEAKALEDERTKLLEESADDLRRHQSFAYSVTALQVAIGLSAVAALIGRRGCGCSPCSWGSPGQACS